MAGGKGQIPPHRTALTGPPTIDPALIDGSGLILCGIGVIAEKSRRGSTIHKVSSALLLLLLLLDRYLHSKRFGYPV